MKIQKINQLDIKEAKSAVVELFNNRYQKVNDIVLARWFKKYKVERILEIVEWATSNASISNLIGFVKAALSEEYVPAHFNKKTLSTNLQKPSTHVEV